MAWFSFLGIFLGVATLITVMSVMNGFRLELLERILGFNGHVTLYIHNPNSFQALQGQLKSIKDAQDVIPMIERQIILTAGSHTRGVLVRGMAIEHLKSRPLIAHSVLQGDLELAPREILVGTRLAQSMGVGIGSMINLVAPEGTPTAIGLLPRTRTFRIRAIFDMGLHEYNNAFVFTRLEDSQELFNMGNGISGLEVFVQNPHELDKTIKTIMTLPEAKDARLVDWQQANTKFFEALQVERNVMFFILTLLIIIAAFNIISGLLMLVKDKTQDIAILRTMGATRSTIIRIFFLTGSSIGGVGTACGSLVGLGFSYNIERLKGCLESLTNTSLLQSEIYFLSKLPARVDLKEVGLIVGFSLLCTLVATLYPSWQAARLNPVEALRYG